MLPFFKILLAVVAVALVPGPHSPESLWGPYIHHTVVMFGALPCPGVGSGHLPGSQVPECGSRPLMHDTPFETVIVFPLWFFTAQPCYYIVFVFNHVLSLIGIRTVGERVRKMGILFLPCNAFCVMHFYCM